ncbi:abortive phage infection protein [Streptomyces samsunensis]|uniref:Abortive phage infection protein n=1 Tax=Streptomyces autolyticus TaxID=75293 RepID=A0ABN4VX45_9ACTN|nr:MULTISPECIES: abortive phage infection protein [Streptomyces]AQA09608.1 abortive phage infection protein [Streptomyces autolyticus]NUH36909.1 abortive phage infection protein [Streptomyces samsunensis]
MGAAQISRARFLQLTGAVAVGTTLSAGHAAAARRYEGTHTKAHGRRAGDVDPGGVRYRGVVYEVGEGETPATAWNPARTRADLRAIRHELHADTVKITGDGVERLTRTAAEAAESGLRIWLEPTLGDMPAGDILDHLAETGRFAEHLRRQGVRVHLNVGCEFMLFVPGIVPGATAVERIENLVKGNYDPVKTAQRLHRFTTRAAAVGRSVFHGPLSYGAAQDEDVDWDLFDLVCIDYYGWFPHRAGHVRELRRYQRDGKPLAITEFGSCTFEGAPRLGGMAWDVVDYTTTPPRVKKELVRSERTQAAYLTDVLEVFESMNLYAAMAYTFITPDAPHRRERQLDLDMASYSLVKVIRDRPADPDSAWHWEPKESFTALADAYARHRRHP